MGGLVYSEAVISYPTARWTLLLHQAHAYSTCFQFKPPLNPRQSTTYEPTRHISLSTGHQQISRRPSIQEISPHSVPTCPPSRTTSFKVVDRLHRGGWSDSGTWSGTTAAVPIIPATLGSQPVDIPAVRRMAKQPNANKPDGDNASNESLPQRFESGSVMYDPMRGPSRSR